MRRRKTWSALVDNDHEADVCVFLAGNFAEARANRCVFENIKYVAPFFPSRSTLEPSYEIHLVNALQFWERD